MKLRFPGYRMFAAVVGLVWVLCGASDPADLIRAEKTIVAQLDWRNYAHAIRLVTAQHPRDCPT